MSSIIHARLIDIIIAIRKADQNGNGATLADLEQIAGYRLETIRRDLEAWQSLGYISVERGGPRRPSRYKLTDRFVGLLAG